MYEFYREENLKVERGYPRWKKAVIWIALFGVLIFVGSLFAPPKSFPAGEIITIEFGSTLGAVSQDFQERNVVRSAGLFESLVVLLEGDRGIAAGDYVFDQPVNAFEVARRITGSMFGIGKISVTLPEGLTAKEMAVVLEAKLENFDEAEFLTLTKDLEGYLFPDTYFFFASTDTEEALSMLRETFQKKVILGLEKDLIGEDLDEIMTMASIIEAEAFGSYAEKEMVSGILNNRLKKGMRLQTDATLSYVNGKESKELTVTDLADNHPYNTYTRDGLPPTPIGNPGLLSIKAALNPKETDYLFYLHDGDGNIHYAKTFEEHKKNIAAYLR